MITQSPRSPNQDNFRTPPWESRDKKPFGHGCRKEAHSILYGGRWWLPRVSTVMSQVSLELLVVCPSTKGARESELTNLLVGFEAGSSK
jgi:hypothetical protein